MKIKIEEFSGLIQNMDKTFSSYKPFESATDSGLEKLKDVERARLSTFNPFKKKTLEIEGLKLAFGNLENLIRDERKLSEYVIFRLLQAIQSGSSEIEIDERVAKYLKSKY